MSFTKVNYIDNQTIITANNLNNIQDAILEGYQPEGTIEASAFAPNAIVEAVYPIGSIYMSVNSTSPAQLFGGTWESINDMFLMCGGTTYAYGNTGGSATHNHTTGNCTLTVSQMPSHNHTPSTYNATGSESGYKYYFTTNLQTSSSSVGRSRVDTGSDKYVMSATGGASDISETATTSSVGGGGAHNHGNTGSSSNLPPYLAVYTWKRVS